MRRLRDTFAWLAVVLTTACAIVCAVTLANPYSAQTSAPASSQEGAGASGSVEDAEADEDAAADDDTDAADTADASGDFRYVGDDTDSTSGEAVDDASSTDTPVAPVADEDLAPHENGIVLASVPAGTTRDELDSLLADADYVDASEVTDDELARGLVSLRITDGTPVADASADLAAVPGVEAAQPNYIYTLAEDEDPESSADLAGDSTSGSAAIEDDGSDHDGSATSDPSATQADQAAGDAAPATGDATAGETDATAQGDATEAQDDQAGAQETTLPEDLGLQSVTVNDPEITKKAAGTWGLESLDAFDAWETVKCAAGRPVRGTTVAVAVIDTGCDTGHEDLVDNIVASYDASGRNSVADFQGHGTHVAGIVSAEANNGKGTAGISYNAGLVIVKASTGDTDKFDTKTLTAAYDWVIKNARTYNILVINLSIGGEAGSNGDTALLQRVDTAYAQGILTVAAAGNGGGSLKVPYACYPGDHETILSVMNLQNTAGGVTLHSDSNYNVDDHPIKDVCAPGTSILSTISDEPKGSQYHGNDSYGTKTGTSMATPYVSGVAALVFTANPGLTPQQVMNVIENTATDLGASGWDRTYGYGEVNAAAAVQKAKDVTAQQATQATLATIKPQISGLSTVSITSASATYTLTVQDPATSWSSFKSLTWTWSSSNAAVGTISATTTADAPATMAVRGVGTTTLTATCTADPSIKASYSVRVESAAMGTAAVAVADQTYTGAALTPAPTVTYGGATLVAGRDYTVEYANNVNAGTAQLTVVGRGRYAGSLTKTFKINPVPLSSASFSLSPSSYTYDGKVHKPSVTATFNGRTLANGDRGDYTKSYEKGDAAALPGTHTVTLTAVPGGNFTGTATAAYAITRPAVSVSYTTHIQNIGWNQGWKSNGDTAGTSGLSYRLEAIQIRLSGAAASLGSIEYCTHIQNIGWKQGWKTNGETAGTSGKSYRLEAIQIRLTGNLAKIYDVYYRVHAQNIGWLDWASNGAPAGTSGLSYRLEAIQIVLVPKGEAAPGATSTPYRSLHYRTHVQNDGWQDYTFEGQTAGTSGRSLRLEGINISLGDQYAQQGVSGGIRYRTHVQNIGWQDWRYDGAMAGTSGQSLRLEAIRIELTGAIAQRYDVYYRVHAQNIGWMGWACDGASAGTAGYAYRLEAIQIRIVPKGSGAPGPTWDSFRQR